ncbi:MAG: DNA translocase FtsK [Patescibacteria group bacterium]
MGRHKKKKETNPLDYVNLPNLSLDERAKKSIGIVFIFVLGLISLLGLFDLSGKTGQFLSRYLALIFGYGKWLVPLVFIFWGILLSKGKKYHIRFSDYLGLFLLFISYQTIFHFFIKQANWELAADSGAGGGYIGFYLSQFFVYLFGFWGGLIVILALFLISLVLVFNTSLSKIIGHESWLANIFKPLLGLAQSMFSRSEDEGESLDQAQLASIQNTALNSWQQKDLQPEAGTAVDSNSKSEVEPEPSLAHRAQPKAQEKIVWPKSKVKIDLPLELLNNKFSKAIGGDTAANALKIKKTLENFGIAVEMGEIKVGPTVTQYAFKPAEGIKLSHITTLNNDLSLALAAHPLRIEAPIPGQSLVGIEVPNKAKAIVGLREILEDNVFKNRKNNLMVALGKDVAGTAWMYDISRMPHLLVAGATNSGKSVCLNTIIVSLLYQNNPDDLRFIMVDPKRGVELNFYNGIPHLLTPVITEVSKTINALKWCLNEMERRYDLLGKAAKKNIQSYNASASEKLPYIIFIIDELADFMMTAGKDLEAAIIRLAQMSRAIGIHLILATQRPSVNVITGLIKANIPTRIAFAVASAVDSKTILDASGAEKLLGQGDMLFSCSEFAKPKRIQGAFLSEGEIVEVVNYIKEKSGPAEYLEGVTDRQKVAGVAGVGLDGIHGDEDELLLEAKSIILKAGKASTSLLQRRLSIGYGRAAKILDMLEEAGVIGPANGSKPREILISGSDFVSATPLHHRSETDAPDSYLDEDEGDDGTLAFSGSDEEAEDIEEAEEELELDSQELDEVVEDEDEILEDIKEDEPQIEAEEPLVTPKAPKIEKHAKNLDPKDDDDEGMYFAR